MILIVNNKKNEKRAVNFLWQKQKVTTVNQNFLEFYVFYHSASIDTDFVAYSVPISTSMPLACTLKKLY